MTWSDFWDSVGFPMGNDYPAVKKILVRFDFVKPNGDINNKWSNVTLYNQNLTPKQMRARLCKLFYCYGALADAAVESFKQMKDMIWGAGEASFSYSFNNFCYNPKEDKMYCKLPTLFGCVSEGWLTRSYERGHRSWLGGLWKWIYELFVEAFTGVEEQREGSFREMWEILVEYHEDRSVQSFDPFGAKSADDNEFTKSYKIDHSIVSFAGPSDAGYYMKFNTEYDKCGDKSFFVADWFEAKKGEKMKNSSSKLYKKYYDRACQQKDFTGNNPGMVRFDKKRFADIGGGYNFWNHPWHGNPTEDDKFGPPQQGGDLQKYNSRDDETFGFVNVWRSGGIVLAKSVPGMMGDNEARARGHWDIFVVNGIAKIFPTTDEYIRSRIAECKSMFQQLQEDIIKLAENKKKQEEVKAVLVAMAKKLNQKPNKYQISKPSHKLVDLRNLYGKNFRGWMEDLTVGKDETSQLAQAVLEENKDKIKTTVSASRSYVMKKDFMFSDTLAVSHPDSIFTNDIQPLVLNEFQPKELITPADVLGPLLDSIIGLLTKVGGALVATGIKVGGKYITNRMIDNYSNNTALLYGSASSRAHWDPKTRPAHQYFTKDPVKMVMNMFGGGGKWLNTYELPYYGNAYMEAKYANNWKAGDASTFLGKGLAGSDSQAGIKMFGIDFPANPKFSVTMDPTRGPITTEFYLINKDSDWLCKNFKFLHAIYAGTSWLHLNYGIIRPPNVYHVLCPGRFQIYWAAMNSEITFEGKLRKNDKASQYLAQFNKAIHDQNNYDVNKTTKKETFTSSDMLWPDAWKVKFEIKDLTPNNFNLYADYYMYGYDIKYLQEYEDTISLGKAASSLAQYIEEMFSKDPKVNSMLNGQRESDDNWKKELKQGAQDLLAVGGKLADQGGEKLKEMWAKGSQKVKDMLK